MYLKATRVLFMPKATCRSRMLVGCTSFHHHTKKVCLEVDLNYRHKDFQSFALTNWATQTKRIHAIEYSCCWSCVMYLKAILQWYHLYLKATQPSKCPFLRDIPIQTLRRIYYVKGSHACALRAEQATRALHSRRVTVTNASVTTICTGYKNARKETCFAYVVDWYKTFLTFCTRKNIFVADLAWWYVMYLKATPIKTYVKGWHYCNLSKKF